MSLDIGKLGMALAMVVLTERGFDRDHYDVPAEFHDELVALGACPVTSRELVARLAAAGLRRPKHRAL